MKKNIYIIFILFCICGCSSPRVSTYNQLYSFTKEKKTVKVTFGKKEVVSLRDFQENEAYDEYVTDLQVKVEKYILEHPELSEEAKKNLRELKVSAGSNKAEVELLLGEPLKVNAAKNNAYGATELWIYKISKIDITTIFIIPVFWTHQGYYLYFKDNALAGIEKHYLEPLIQTTSPSATGIENK